MALEHTLAGLAQAYPGPGGAVAVLKDGEILARHAWGFADLERRIPFTPQTLFRICSISKQFTCAAMLDQHPDIAVLDADIAARMPVLESSAPRAIHLANNQSGLRDYWATAMLCGSPIEAPFGEASARRLIARTRTLQFEPGSRYSYCNQNFRLLGDAISARAGRSLGELLRARVFDRAGMPTALLCADTAAMPDGTTGYEGSLDGGFRPAVNNILWTGDAGIGASLDDMIAWERFIDATRDDEGGLYRRLSTPQRFNDGAAALYGHGLAQMELFGRPATGHGGGLRGWRSCRFNLPQDRISVVVLFNHMADPRAAAMDLLAQLIPARPKASIAAGAAWDGNYQDPETGLLVRLATAPDDRVRLHYIQAPELLDLTGHDEAGTGATRISRNAAGVQMHRATDHHHTLLRPLAEPGPMPADIAGCYYNAELGARFLCQIAGGAPYGGFCGFLGEGQMQIMVPVGPNLWRLPMQRALDCSPPGEWTVEVQRDAEGAIAQLIIGCWLARQVVFLPD